MWWWLRKLGYHALTKPKSKAKDWIILLDESKTLGAEKLLVILGIRESHIPFGRPLRYTDMEPLWISASTHWNGDFIRDLLVYLRHKLGQITYAVGDYGSDLKKGLREAGIPHIHDITHHIALLLQQLYADDPAYQDVTQQLAHIRRRFGETTAGHLRPPKQRKHSRYHDLRPLAEYGHHVLAYLQKPPTATPSTDAFREAMLWIVEYQAFFDELHEVTTVVCEVEKLVKHHGVSPTTVAQCSHDLPAVTTGKGRRFKFDILVYFHATLAVTHAMDAMLCTSDILESAFGKYKTYLSCNPMAGITDLALCIAAFTCSLAAQDILEAMESTRNHDVTQWGRVFIGPTLYQKRRQAFSDSQSQKEGE